jgi:membrane protein
MKKPYYQGAAAELAFFYLLSMVPLITILGELLGFFSISLDLIESFLTSFMSKKIAASFATYLQYSPSGTISLLFVIFALWAASKGQYSMMRIANYTYLGEECNKKNFLKERARAIFTVIITTLATAFSLVILVYGKALAGLAALYVVRVLGLPFTLDHVWYLLRWPIGVAMYFLAISLLYYFLPSDKKPFKKFIPGSVFASAGMLIASWVYSYYISTFVTQNILYGSLGSVVGLLMWFYILGYVLVVGIVLNVAWEETK